MTAERATADPAASSGIVLFVGGHSIEQCGKPGGTAGRGGVVDAQQDSLHTARQRFKIHKRFVGICSNHPPSNPARSPHLRAQRLRLAALPSVGCQHNDRTARHASHPPQVQKAFNWSPMRVPQTNPGFACSAVYGLLWTARLAGCGKTRKNW